MSRGFEAKWCFLRWSRVNPGPRLLIAKNGHSLPPLALCHDTFHLVQPAIGARRSMFDNITSHLSRSTALTRFGSSPLHRSPICASILCRASIEFRRGGCFIRAGRQSFVIHGGRRWGGRRSLKVPQIQGSSLVNPNFQRSSDNK